MRQPFRHVGPDRIQIRQGGGVLGIFGLPFFAAGVFMLLIMSGLIEMKNSDSVSLPGQLGLLFMGLVFTAVGGALSFGRGWTTIDSTRREVIKQYGLMVPMYTDARRIDEFNTVILGFVRGDSDSADTFPVTLRSSAGVDLKLDSSTQYGDARGYAAAVAALLRLDFEDATTDHPVRVPSGQADIPLQQRLQMDGLQNEPARPPDARSEVTREADGVRITIPNPRAHPFAIALTLIPVVISAVFVSPLFRFFRQTRTPDPVGWAFIGFVMLFFGVLPAMTALNGYLRSRRGRTIVTVSSRGIDIRERGAWRTRAGELAAGRRDSGHRLQHQRVGDDSRTIRSGTTRAHIVRIRDDVNGNRPAHAVAADNAQSIRQGTRHHHQDPPGPDDVRPGADRRGDGLRPLADSSRARRPLGLYHSLHAVLV